MTLEFKRLTEVDLIDIISLNNNPDVLRQMPLGSANFDLAKAKEWVQQKDAQWLQYGYGPWAFLIDQKFAGWGGLQYEEGDADLALVLHPDFWGSGKAICQEIAKHAFTSQGLESITILLPPSRTRIKGIFRLGFQPDGEVDIEGARFQRFRLYAPNEPVPSDS
ncbi:GNAT family N-acetyltransferase [Comamonas resistens]|uniref:GNAT family N-acetyltransferase n=1 Tax=Comamonas resistens TaxID=3046670 RepID=A0ABY8SLB1_9BURK|nr:GNAT family N-acetyltransferase [Comamonas resistens]MDL5038329.1 GNAT family N-acetyltransferase [Comamonas resistens]WHS63862.1 GNAT family N-acetyltransferase [Comamonas resistens]